MPPWIRRTRARGEEAPLATRRRTRRYFEPRRGGPGGGEYLDAEAGVEPAITGL